jgi:hypothetical protein
VKKGNAPNYFEEKLGYHLILRCLLFLGEKIQNRKIHVEGDENEFKQKIVPSDEN